MSSTNQTILNLDDDPDFNNILRVILKKEGFKLKSATTPEEFAKLINKEPPLLCLVDINLDVAMGAGYQMIQAMRNRLGFELPILVISRRASQEDIGRALELGANDFIPKPIDDTYLIQKINQYLPRENFKPLPYFKVSQKDWPCEVSFNLEIYSLSEFGITFTSNHFLSKGTYLQVDGEFVRDLTGEQRPLKLSIHNSWIDEKSHRFMAFSEFNGEDIQLLSSVRAFIIKNSGARDNA